MLATQRIGFLERLHSPARPVLVFDGATGTSLQQMDLTADDFGGLALEGCNENLVFTRPDAVQAVETKNLDTKFLAILIPQTLKFEIYKLLIWVG